MLFVAERCSEALQTDEFKHLRNTVSEKALILAALFHDFHHSGGFSSDIINIGRAIAYVSKHLKSMYSTACVEEICKNIWVTCFTDGVFPHEPTTDPILFRNIMKLLTCVIPSASPSIHRSRERRLMALSKKVEKMHEDMIDIFNEYFPEYAEDLYRLDAYDAEIKAEAKHISEMFKKYPNYRHD
jgi:hypothetical protein